MMKLIHRIVMLSVVMFLTTASAADMASWQTSIKNKKKTPGIIQLYTFSEGKGLQTRNLLSDAPFSEMVIAGSDYFVPSEKDYPQWVNGRWSGKRALSVGTMKKSIGRTHFYGVKGSDFSVELWVRTNINKGSRNQVLFASVGSGYNDGWLIQSNGYATEFVLGRPRGTGDGKGRVLVRSKGFLLTPHVWHQITGVLNGKNVQLYIDGKLAGEKQFDGIYKHLLTPSRCHKTPEIDTRGGALKLGSGRSYKSNGRFDIGELAIFSRALSAEEIARFYEEGKPDTTPEEQVRKHNEELASQSLLEGITLDFPKDSFGYLPNDKPVPVIININDKATRLFNGSAHVDFTVKHFMGDVVKKESKVVALTNGKAIQIKDLVNLKKCGLYKLSVKVSDKDKKLLKRFHLDFAIRLPIPPRKDIPDSSIFSSYGGLNYELPTFGTKVERIIQPIFGRTKDGEPNYARSDEIVNKCHRMGLDVLYCICIGFWDGRYNTPEDWKANPKIHTDHVRNMVNRYKDKVKYWEIFNEPNGGGHGMTPEDYVGLLKEAYEIIKKLDPEAKVVGPCGTSNYHTWTEEVLAAGGGKYLDIVSFHNYISRSPLANRRMGRLETVKESLRKHVGHMLPLWNSECGIHHPERINGRPASDEELLKIYGGRARKTPEGVLVGVDAITMVNEHLSACWQVQSLLVEKADGVEKYFTLMRPSQPYPRFSKGDQFVTEKGVAIAAAQAVLMNATKARFIPTNITGSTCIALTDNRGKTDVALFADKPASLVFNAAEKAGVVFKGMDYLGNPLSFTTGESGLLALRLTEEPIYILGVPESFGINSRDLKVTCSQTQLEPMSRVEVNTEVTNPYDRPITASIKVNVSAGIATPEVKSFKLAPKASRKIKVAWQTGGMEKGKHWIRAQLHIDGQFYSVVELDTFYSHGKMNRITRLPNEFKLDGDLDKWKDIIAENSFSREQVVLGRPVEGAPSPAFWAGPKDLSYTVKTAWTKAGIHFLVTVTDNILHPPQNPKEAKAPWLIDGMELFVDFRPLKERITQRTAGTIQAGIVPRMGDKIESCPLVMISEKPLPLTLECVSRKHDGGYIIEGTIKPTPEAKLSLKDGMQFNMDISIDDNDDLPDQKIKLGRRIQMALHGTADNHRVTTDYGRYVLSDNVQAPNLVSDSSFKNCRPLPDDAKEKQKVKNWRIANIYKMPPTAKEKTFWGIKQVNGKNALWIGTEAEEHIEPVWDSRIPAKEKTVYCASGMFLRKLDGNAQWAGCNAGVMFFNAKGRFIGHRNLGRFNSKKTSGTWQKFAGNFVTPAETAKVGFRLSILSKDVKGFANYYWTDISLKEIPEHVIGNKNKDFNTFGQKGKRISRTMSKLATSTPKDRKKVKILFYGQSITAQGWTHALGKRLKNKYFAADVTYKNRAIGGFTAERLVRTAKQDLYPEYPDLVIFHVFGGKNGEWEEIIRNIRKFTTAEILVTTHHLSHQGNNWVEKEHNKESQMIRDIAEKYNCELVEVREDWREYLKDNSLQIKDMLRDSIHLNEKGCKLMESLVWEHLQYNPEFKNPHAKWIRHIPVKPAKDGSIKVKFTGNRVDIIAGKPGPNMGTAKILIDGKPPSANPQAYTCTRPSNAKGAWWPAIYTIGNENPQPQAETWTLTVTEVPEKGPFKFSVTGSKTGFDGTGNSSERFVSNSKRVVIEPKDFGGISAAEKYTKKKCPVGFKVKWDVVPMFIDTYVPLKKIDSTKYNSSRVVQLIENRPHTLEIIPENNCAAPIKEVVVYEPPLK